MAGITPKPVKAVIVLVQPRTERGREIADKVWLVPASADQRAATVSAPVTLARPEDFADTLLGLPDIGTKRTINLWFAQGWPDWILSGFTDAIDTGAVVYRAINLDGQKSTLTGSLRGRPLRVSSMRNWTGHGCQDWHAQAVAQAPQLVAYDRACAALPHLQRVYLEIMAAIIQATQALDTGPLCPTPGGQARAMWRRWLGPQVPIMDNDQCEGDWRDECKWETIPLPYAPKTAKLASRLACYGLPVQQFQHGHSGAPVYVWDLSGAYLTALCHTPLPAVYCKTCSKGTIADLKCPQRPYVALALVRLRPSARAWPTKYEGRTEWCAGDFWTWLCGDELTQALASDSVIDVDCVYLWNALTREEQYASAICNVRDNLRGSDALVAGLLWRTLYAALVGGWAAWAREWVDVDDPSPHGRWASWDRYDHHYLIDYAYRSIAGRVQRRRLVGDAPSARPIAYACITAAVRSAVEKCRACLPPGSVLAVCADAIWVTARGHERMRDAGFRKLLEPYAWKHKLTYDDVWMDGDSRAVARIGNELFPVVPGVPVDARIGRDGRGRWAITEPWHLGGRPSALEGVRSRTLSWDGKRHMKRNAGPLREAPAYMELSGGVLRDELLPVE